jgi:hypothetical protein
VLGFDVMLVSGTVPTGHVVVAVLVEVDVSVESLGLPAAFVVVVVVLPVAGFAVLLVAVLELMVESGVLTVVLVLVAEFEAESAGTQLMGAVVTAADPI